MELSGMFTTQGMLLLLLLLGYVLTRIGIIPPEGKKLLSALTVNVTLPASILHAFQMEFDADIARSCVAITLVGLCIQLGGAVLAQLHLPAVVSLTIKNVAGGNTMCAMMLVGTVLAQTDLKTIAEGQVLRYCAVRLLLMPGLTLLACRLAGVDGVVTSVAVVLSGTPAPTTVSALATKYGVGEQLAAKCVVASTLLSLATIPLWCLLVR